MIIKIFNDGATRRVIRFNNIVFKFPRRFLGILHNFKELFIWLKYRDKKLAPILFSIPFIVNVMPYYNNLFKGELEDIPEGFILYLKNLGIDDIHDRNIAYDKNNNLILFDYGNGYYFF